MWYTITNADKGGGKWENPLINARLKAVIISQSGGYSALYLMVRKDGSMFAGNMRGRLAIRICDCKAMTQEVVKR